MSQLPSGLSISEVALPGAHNAGANSVLSLPGRFSGLNCGLTRHIVGLWSNCQDCDVSQLLLKGVRLLDLRLGSHEGEIYICHTVICDLLLTKVLQEVFSFLESHPTELVLLLLKRDWHQGFEAWQQAQQQLVEQLKQQLAGSEALSEPLERLVKADTRAVVLLEMPMEVKQLCGIRVTSENLQCSWRPEVQSVEQMLQVLEDWRASGRMKPCRGCLKLMEAAKTLQRVHETIENPFEKPPKGSKRLKNLVKNLVKA